MTPSGEQERLLGIAECALAAAGLDDCETYALPEGDVAIVRNETLGVPGVKHEILRFTLASARVAEFGRHFASEVCRLCREIGQAALRQRGLVKQVRMPGFGGSTALTAEQYDALWRKGFWYS